MPKRMTITLEDDAATLLPQLAPSPRKQGEFVSGLVRAAAGNQQAAASTTLEMLALKVLRLDQEVAQLRSYVEELEDAALARAHRAVKARGEDSIAWDQALAELTHFP